MDNLSIPPSTEPTYKHPAIDAMITKTTGKDRRKAVQTLICPFCDQLVTGHRDQLSHDEHRNSGLCQRCQDEMFGKGGKS